MSAVQVLKELERLMNDKANGMSMRVRLAVKDVMELKRANWVPRRWAPPCHVALKPALATEPSGYPENSSFLRTKLVTPSCFWR